MSEDLAQAIDQILDAQLRQKTDEMAREIRGQLESVYAAALMKAQDDARSDASVEAGSALASQLAASARAIRAEDSVTGIAAALVEGASKFCGRSYLFIHRGNQLLGFRAAGRFGKEGADSFQRLTIQADQAAAIHTAITSLSSSVEPGGEEQLSSEVTQLLGLTGEDSVHLFPVALRDKVLAVLGCDAGLAADDAEPAPVVSPAIETLVALAEAWMEAVGTRRKQSAA